MANMTTPAPTSSGAFRPRGLSRAAVVSCMFTPPGDSQLTPIRRATPAICDCLAWVLIMVGYFKKCFQVSLEKAEWQWRTELRVMEVLRTNQL
jgi:hypothetical protein